MKNKNLSLAIGALFCSAAIGALAIQNNTYASTEEETAAVTAVMDVLLPIYQTAVDNYNSDPDALGAPFSLDQTDSTDNYSHPRYQPESIKAAIPLRHSQNIAILNNNGSSSEIDGARTLAISALEGLGFESYPYTFYYPEHLQYINNDTGVICMVAAYGSSCGSINWWSVNDDQAEFLNGIGAAFYAKENTYPVVNGFYDNSLPEIFDSEYEPYQYTLVSIQNGTGMFYRQGPTSNWVYFAITQAPLDCSDYAGEAQKGFAGYICYNGTEESKVAVVSESEPESSVKTPDTGIITGNSKTLTVFSSILGFTAFGIVSYGIGYSAKRIRNHIHFDKH